MRTIDNDQSFEFGFNYNTQMVTCRIDAGESDYGVHFDYRLVAMLELDEDGVTWIDIIGNLEPETVQLIGKKIEDNYE